MGSLCSKKEPKSKDNPTVKSLVEQRKQEPDTVKELKEPQREFANLNLESIQEPEQEDIDSESIDGPDDIDLFMHASIKYLAKEEAATESVRFNLIDIDDNDLHLRTIKSTIDTQNKKSRTLGEFERFKPYVSPEV